MIQEVIDIKQFITQKCTEGFSALISSHALKELLFFCNKFIFIHKGKVIVKIDSKKYASFEQYDSFASTDSVSLKKFLKENELPFLEIDSLKTIYFKSNDKSLYSFPFDRKRHKHFGKHLSPDEESREKAVKYVQIKHEIKTR